MAKTYLTKEVSCTVPNQVGALGKVCSQIAEAKVNIQGLCCWGEPGKPATFLFATSDPDKTADLCQKGGWSPKTTELVACELGNKVGALAEACTKLAGAGINIKYCYATTGNGSTTTVYFVTSDNNKAVKTLS